MGRSEICHIGDQLRMWLIVFFGSGDPETTSSPFDASSADQSPPRLGEI
jgi:hypothetical protein